jgi:hypothetical protein
MNKILRLSNQLPNFIFPKSILILFFFPFLCLFVWPYSKTPPQQNFLRIYCLCISILLHCPNNIREIPLSSNRGDERHLEQWLWIKLAHKITFFWNVAPHNLAENYRVSEERAAAAFRL